MSVLCRLRQRQMRNMACALLLSHGIPMLQMGDEYGHSKNGNNNTYCHDSPLNWVDWQQVARDEQGFARFMRGLIAFRSVATTVACLLLRESFTIINMSIVSLHCVPVPRFDISVSPTLRRNAWPDLSCRTVCCASTFQCPKFNPMLPQS
jgi:pullulanase/glycogen debranching enzyme